MSEEALERIYTINLGKVLLSPNNQRAKRAINMIRQFASKHMKSENVKIEEEISHLVWERGIRHPPRKLRVKLTKDEDGNIIVSNYQEEKKVEEKPKKEEKKVEEKPKEEKKTEEKVKEKIVEDKPKKEEKKAEKKTEEKSKKEEKKSTEAKSEKKSTEAKSEKKSTEAKSEKKQKE